MRLLHAGSSIPLLKIDTKYTCLTRHHLPPIENYFRIEVTHLIEVHQTIALHILQEIEVNLEARGDSDDSQSHAQSCIKVECTWL